MKYASMVLGVIILIYLVMDFNSRTAEYHRLQIEHATVAARLESRVQTREALKQALVYATSEAAVREYAAENNMGKAGDMLVIPLQIGAITPTPTLQPTFAAPTQPENWQKWMAIFMDTPVPEKP